MEYNLAPRPIVTIYYWCQCNCSLALIWEAGCCRHEIGPEHTGHFVQPHVAAHCGGDIYSRRKPLFSSFGEHTAVCGSSVRQAVARPRHRQSVCIHNIHVAATCRPSVLGSATMRGHMWLNSVAMTMSFLTSIGYTAVWLSASGYVWLMAQPKRRAPWKIKLFNVHLYLL